MVNITLGREILCKRGLKHGDPLSPQIFVILANWLNHTITRCHKEGIIKGLGYRDESIAVIYLHYAGGTLIFGRECLPEAMIFKWIISVSTSGRDLRSISTKAP